MKVILLGSTGKLGRHVWRQALAARHQLTLFVRNREKLVEDCMRVEGKSPESLGLRIVEGDVTDKLLLADAFHGQDAVVSTLSQVGDTGPTLYQMVRTVVTQTATVGVRRLIVTAGGGALSLRTPDGPLLFEEIAVFRRNKRLYEVQRQHVANLATLYTQDRKRLAWTMCCPPDMIGTDEDYQPTGRVISTLDIAPRSGRSTYADAASIIVREIGSEENAFHRVGIATRNAGKARL